MRLPPILAVALAVSCVQIAPAAAQTAGPGQKPTRGFLSALAHNLGDDVRHIPRKKSVYWLVGGSALALAIHPEDGTINRHLLGKPDVDKLFIPGKYMGNGAVILATASATYLFGRLESMPRLQHLGMDEIEGAILAQAVTEGAKLAIRRQRPVNPDGKQARGYSMPSGHTALTFTAATILQQHLGYRAGIPTYLVASYVAMSRLHDNRHYASDVVMGVATGIIIGRAVTFHGRKFWGGPVVVPGGVEFVLAKR